MLLFACTPIFHSHSKNDHIQNDINKHACSVIFIGMMPSSRQNTFKIRHVENVIENIPTC